MLIPGGILGRDQLNLEQYIRLRDEEPEAASDLVENSLYHQKLLAHVTSGEKIPLREGITWIADLLPYGCRGALDALEAYMDVYFLNLPDGRQHGLSDAMAILRSRYFSTDSVVANSVLFSLSPTDFEHLIESLYRRMGYLTKMTKRSHDGGRDVIAIKNESGKKEKNLIQCKRWQDVVGVEDARTLGGVVADEKATKGTLITTSHFSPDAQAYAGRNPSIELIEFKQLQRLLNEQFGQFWVAHTDSLLNDSKERHPLSQRQ